MTPNNIRQSYMPEGAVPVKNPNGTAPSFIVEDSRAVIFSLPGVPVDPSGTPYALDAIEQAATVSDGSPLLGLRSLPKSQPQAPTP